MAHTETDCELRLLTESDAAAYSLRLESLLHAPEVFEAAYEDQMDKTDDDCQNFLASNSGIGYFEGTRLVGMVFFCRNPGRKALHRGSIFNFYVTRDYRGSGVARNLIRVIEAHAKAAKISQLELYVSSGAKRAIAFYTRVGFEITGRIPRAIFHDGQHHDFMLMVMTLNPTAPAINADGTARATLDA